MNILAFDTCFAMCSVAVANAAGSPAARVAALAEPMAAGHAERLMPMIEEALAAAGITASEIDVIATTHGPGTFTGTRIAVSAARGLALATGRPIVAVSSLALMAEDPAIAPPANCTGIAVVMNANRGEVYIQLFDVHTRSPRSTPLLLPVETAAGLSPSPLLAVGSGAGLVADAATRAGRDVHAAHLDLLPNACNMIVLASRTLPLADPLRPLYLRAPDARPQTGKSLARAP